METEAEKETCVCERERERGRGRERERERERNIRSLVVILCVLCCDRVFRHRSELVIVKYMEKAINQHTTLHPLDHECSVTFASLRHAFQRALKMQMCVTRSLFCGQVHVRKCTCLAFRVFVCLCSRSQGSTDRHPNFLCVPSSMSSNSGRHPASNFLACHRRTLSMNESW
jgi:hypothetical protein